MSTTAGVVVAETEAAEADVCCANCGIAGVDDVTLEECDGCDHVRYCGEKCREEHREQHGEECKIRAKEIRDRQLFTQPDGTNLGECPICFLPLPIDLEKSMFWTCCSETICKGCVIANTLSNLHDDTKARSCPFCRTRSSASDNEMKKKTMKRVKANDPAALCFMGGTCYDKGDYDGAFEYWTKAAALGDLNAHFKLGNVYMHGRGVEKDEEKALYHWEKAAIVGNPIARHNLACYEGRHGNMKRAVKHYIIAANQGYDESMKALWAYYSAGYITKEELEAALRTNKAAIDAMISPQRKIAEEMFRGLLHK
jgi:hypothetical protein